VSDSLPLTHLEQELLELSSMAFWGETTATLDEEMLALSPGRATVETTLRGLVARGLMTTERVDDDDWWPVTPAGRRAIGLPRRRPPVGWMNPSSGPFRRSPVNAFFYGIWHRIRSRVKWLLYADTHWRN
jgi:hypothetical protein